MVYKAVVQSVLLFASETWLLSQPMLKALEGFHQRVACSIAGKQPYLDRRTGEWVYPPINKVLEEVGIYSIDHYVKKRQNTVADYVTTRPILTFAKNQSGRRAHTPAGDGGTKSTEFSILKTLVMKGNKSVYRWLTLLNDKSIAILSLTARAWNSTTHLSKDCWLWTPVYTCHGMLHRKALLTAFTSVGKRVGCESETQQ